MTNYIERYWRDAKPEDLTKPQLMVARFKDYPDGFPGNLEITTDLLGGFTRSKSGNIVEWFDSSGNRFNNAQVYDAPDPGEGWRLIDPDKDDYQQDGIEFWNSDKNTWVDRRACSGSPFVTDMHYRRRITPTVTYVPFTWEDREELRGRIITYVDRKRTVEFRCESFAIDDDGLLVNDTYTAWLCKNAVFVDTKEPVGKKVTQ